MYDTTYVRTTRYASNQKRRRQERETESKITTELLFSHKCDSLRGRRGAGRRKGKERATNSI